MPFAAELDDRRQEVRYRSDVGGVLLWPKLDGANIAVTAIPAPTGYVYKPDGTLSHQVNVTNATVSSVTRLTGQPVALAFNLELGENYRLEFSYTYSGAAYVESVPFDVMIEPWGSVGISLNDLVDEWADLGQILERQAELQEATRTAEQQAQILALRATQAVRSMVKKKVESEGQLFPTYIFNKDELRPTVVAVAIYRACVAQGLTSESLVELARFWREEADRRFASMPALKFATGAVAVPDSELSGFRATRQRRSW